MNLKYKVTKIGEPILTPRFDREHAWWESHHVTNPALIRLSCDERVFMGYRAGGDRDHYIIHDNDVFSSSFGMAILNERADKLLHRFTLPILRMERSISLPQSPPEYEAFIKAHGDKVCVLHDFRLYERNGYLYVIYHDGAILRAYDAIARMPVKAFLGKIERSIEINDKPHGEIMEEWRTLWWDKGVWEPCGIEEDRLVFPMVSGEASTKTDIVYYHLEKGTQLMRRPIPDISVLPVSDSLCGYKTPDGDQEMGVLESCIRPGYMDNSHIGPNGMPTKAKIGDRDVYIDICHGVYNEALAKDIPFTYAMTYMPYFRIKDARTGDLLYYSEDPIIDPEDDVWEEYTRHGRWISYLPHHYILFAGGQTEMVKGKNGEDDLFTFFAGAGDTAVVRGEFTIRQLTPPDVLADIAGNVATVLAVDENTFAIKENPAGWRWKVYNSMTRGGLIVERSLGEICRAQRTILPRPGYFDSHGLLFDGQSICLDDDIGYCIMYTGIRYIYEGDEKKTLVSAGLLVLDEENLERVLYRSMEPIGEVAVLEGHEARLGENISRLSLAKAIQSVPSQTRREILYAREKVKEGLHWRSHHTVWLEERAKRYLRIHESGASHDKNKEQGGMGI